MKVVLLSGIDMSKVKPILKARSEAPFKPSEDGVRNALMKIARGNAFVEQRTVKTRMKGDVVSLGCLKGPFEVHGRDSSILFGLGVSVDKTLGLAPSVVMSDSRFSYHVCFGDLEDRHGLLLGNSVPLSVHRNPCVAWGHSHHGQVYNFDLLTVSKGSVDGPEPLVMFPKSKHVIDSIAGFCGKEKVTGMAIGFGNWKNVEITNSEGNVHYAGLGGEGTIVLRISEDGKGGVKYSGRVMLPTPEHAGNSKGRYVGGPVVGAETEGVSYFVFFPAKD